MIIKYIKKKKLKGIILAICVVMAFLDLMGQKAPRQKVQAKLKSEIKKQGEVGRNNRVIHIDLLTRKKRNFQPPLRNIFLPQLKGSKDLAASMLAQEGASSQAMTESFPGKADAAQKEGWGIFLQYVGFIKSPDRIVALVVYQNQPWVVKIGDVLEDGSVVSAISEDEIEITGPSGKKKTFRLIEERP